jgi:hypothetical protein
VCTHIITKSTSLTAIISVYLCSVAFSTVFCALSHAENYYVCGSGSACGAGWSTGSDSNACTSRFAPCQTITAGIGRMNSGDTLIVGNGIYTQSTVDMPSGTSGGYTTIQAENDFGVLIDGSGWADSFIYGIEVGNRSYVKVQGFRVKMSQTNLNNGPVIVIASDHIKIIRIGAWHAPVDGNAATFDIGPDSDYVLVEECYAYGGARYQFINYWSDHTVFRRNVARNDYWTGSLQCAGFVNYDSVNTVWQNNIAIDSNTSNCSGGLYGGFWGENKDDHAPDTTQTFYGNIVLNVINGLYSAGDSQFRMSGTRTVDNHVIWGGNSGYWGAQGPGTSPTATLRNMTVGALSGSYDGGNGEAAGGTGVSFTDNIPNTVRNSIFCNNHSFGIADYTVSDYNAFYGNGAAVGGQFHTPSVGTHSLTTTDPLTNSLLYLPRIEAGSTLMTAGDSGGQIGARIMYRMGTSGTLSGEAGWNTLTSEPLWPFPNEAQIKSDMSSYSGGGGVGTRGFCAGTSMDGTPQSLTRYIWEYLGNQIPADIYGSADRTPPTVVTFDVPSTSTSLTVPVKSLIAADDTGVTGYLITESSTPPPAGATGWKSAPPAVVAATGAGVKTFHAWARDAAGNISTAATATVYVALTVGSTFYVRSDGHDTASGANNTNNATTGAWLTLQYAADHLSAGDTVLVADGTYAGFYVETSGTPSAPISFRALGSGAHITSRNSRTADGINIESWEGTPADYIIIDGFNVHNQTRMGIRAIAGTGIIIENCIVHNNGDCGIFSGGTPHIQVLDNTTYSNGSTLFQHNIYLSNAGTDNPIVRGNIAYSAGGGNGIQLNGDWLEGGDGYIDNAIIEKNIVYGNAAKGFSLISVRHGIIRNNVIYNNGSSAGGIHLVDQQGSNYSTDNTVVNNTIDEPNIACVRINTGSTNNAVFNNICIGSTGIVFEGSGNYKGSNYSASTAGSDIFANAALRDYHLLPASPARDYGVASYQSKSAPTFDFESNTRPSGTAYDAGAYEYVPAIQQNQTLSVTLNGSGSGNINSDPSGYSCLKGTCTSQIATGTQLTLIAAPNNTQSSRSYFNGWTGDCAGATGNSCTLTLYSNKNATATFTTLQPVRIPGVNYYASLQSAYNAAGSTSDIQAQEVNLTGGLIANSDNIITLKGGYNADYSGASGYTAMAGNVSVVQGTLIVDNLVIY